MNANFFGPKLWDYLACYVLNYPENPTRQDKHIARKFLHTVMETIPCEPCRISSLIYVRMLPPDPFVDSRAGLCVWLYRFKSKVNAKLGKHDCSFLEFISKYENVRAGCSRSQIGTLPHVAVWSQNAWDRYSDVDTIVTTFYRKQRVEHVCKILLIMLVLWCIYSRRAELSGILRR